VITAKKFSVEMNINFDFTFFQKSFSFYHFYSKKNMSDFHYYFSEVDEIIIKETPKNIEYTKIILDLHPYSNEIKLSCVAKKLTQWVIPGVIWEDWNITSHLFQYNKLTLTLKILKQIISLSEIIELISLKCNEIRMIDCLTL
jgi:hypothetical protein